MEGLLSVRKQKWANHFKPEFLRGAALNPSVAAEMRYYARLSSLIDTMTEEVEREVRAMFEEPHAEVYFAQDATVSAQARIITNKLMEKFQRLFDMRSKPYAEGMVDGAAKDSSRSLHGSLKDLSGGLSLKTTSLGGDIGQVLSAQVTENVSLIRTIPQRYLSGVQQAVMRSVTTGRGLADLVPYLQKERGVTLRRARIIAEDQTRKAFSNISRARMEKAGIREFEWLHSHGSLHPRRLHIDYSGQVFRFDNPPVIDERTGERGFPGQAINCKCRMKPVIRFAGEDDAVGTGNI